MNWLARYRVLICGLVSPVLAFVLYVLVYETLTSLSTNHEKDWLFRLSVSTLALTIPFIITLVLAVKDNRRHVLFLSGKIGVFVAGLSLALAWQPVHDGILRAKQSRNQAMHDVAAPVFNTPDLLGNMQSLNDQKGKVVVVNLWATWCGPCRAEMPKLDYLYQERKGQGLIVYGLSDEDAGVQRKYLEQVPVTYPLLTVNGQVPSLYRDIVRYPAIFLIDRQGRLQPAPGPEEPFEKLQSVVDSLLHNSS